MGVLGGGHLERGEVEQVDEDVELEQGVEGEGERGDELVVELQVVDAGVAGHGGAEQHDQEDQQLLASL